LHRVASVLQNKLLLCPPPGLSARFYVDKLKSEAEEILQRFALFFSSLISGLAFYLVAFVWS
jgi:hypothetical protein